MSRLIPKKLFGGKQDYDKQYQYELYLTWLNLPAKEKTLRNINIAKSYIQNGPNIKNLFNAGKALLGGFNPSNPYIIAEIAPTPSFPEEQLLNAKYFKAIKEGNLKEVLRLRDLHAGNKSKLFHKTNNKFYEFDPDMPKYGNKGDVAPNDPFIHVGTRKAADKIKGNILKELYVDSKNPLIILDIHQYDGLLIIRDMADNLNLDLNTYNKLIKEYRNAGKGYDYIEDAIEKNKKIREILSRYNYDGIKYFNAVEDVGNLSIGVLKSNQLKLTNPITYDDAGNIIPLSQRDNPLNPDIRYGLIPILGSSVLGVSKKQQGGALAQQRVAENQRHSTLAKHYILHPTLPNLAKAAYHWWKGTPGLGGQPENDYIYKTGIAPLPDTPISVVKRAEAVATGTKYVGPSAKVTSMFNNAQAMEKGTVQATTKKLTRNNLKYNQEILSLRLLNPDYERQYNKIARKLFMTDDPKKIREGLKLILDLTTLFKKGL